jgi:hypothetical protein
MEVPDVVVDGLRKEAVPDASPGAREAGRLGEEEPMLVGPPECQVRGRGHVPGGHDVKDGGTLDTVGIVQAHAVNDEPAAVVADRGEAVEPGRGHQADLIGGHDALAVLGVIGSPGRLCRAAVTPQVRQNDRVILRQGWCRLVPHHVGLGIAVQHQDRRC